MAVNWLTFGWSLAATLLFGILFASLVRWSARRKMVAQTAWAVAIGVTFTLMAMIPLFGLEAVALMFCYFMASGIPMIVEYVLRIQKEMDQDTEKAKGLAKDLLK